MSSLKFGGHIGMRNTKPIYQNRYAGTCTMCDRHIEAGAGYTEKSRGAWVVFH